MIELRIIASKLRKNNELVQIAVSDAIDELQRISDLSVHNYMRKDIIRPRKRDPVATPSGSDARIRIQTTRLATAVLGQGSEFEDTTIISQNEIIARRTVRVPYAYRWEQRFGFIKQAINELNNE